MDMQVRYAIRLPVSLRVSRALVVNHARDPVGIVTLRDMVLRGGAAAPAPESPSVPGPAPEPARNPSPAPGGRR